MHREKKLRVAMWSVLLIIVFAAGAESRPAFDRVGEWLTLVGEKKTVAEQPTLEEMRKKVFDMMVDQVANSQVHKEACRASAAMLVDVVLNNWHSNDFDKQALLSQKEVPMSEVVKFATSEPKVPKVSAKDGHTGH